MTKKSPKPGQNQNLRDRVERMNNINQDQENDNIQNKVNNEEDNEPKIMTKAEIKKAALKEKKKREKEARRQQIELQNQKHEEKMQKILEREKEEEEKEEKEREYLLELEEERKRKEQEEYNKWKDMFEEGDEGNVADDLENEGDLLNDFINYIKVRVKYLNKFQAEKDGRT